MRPPKNVQSSRDYLKREVEAVRPYNLLADVLEGNKTRSYVSMRPVQQSDLSVRLPQLRRIALVLYYSSALYHYICLYDRIMRLIYSTQYL